MQHLIAQAKQRRWQGICAIGILIVVASMGLAACNYPGSARTSSGSAPSVANQTATPGPPIRLTPSPTRGTGTASKACGVVHGFGYLKVVPKDMGAAQAENCFWQAFQHCQPATLVFIAAEVHTTLTRIFTLHNEHGACAISDEKQPAGSSSTAATYTCTGLTRQTQALIFTACGQDGTIEVLGY